MKKYRYKKIVHPMDNGLFGQDIVRCQGESGNKNVGGWEGWYKKH